MKHPDDDDLILYFYGEAEAPEEIGRLLESSPELRARYETLRQVLGAVDALPVPERPDFYGARVWAQVSARLRPQLEAPTRRAWWPVRLDLRWALPGVAAVLLLAVGFLAGRQWPQREAPAAVASDGRERILLAAVAEHLERSERLLVEVSNADASELAAERAWARDLLAANRLYRQSTDQGGRPRLAALLDELEPFLLELAHAPEEAPAEEMDDLRRRIEDRALLFKVRVVSQRLENPADDATL
ncbi:MAG TPA: hypothetical protein VLQ45_25005 [Thermoanaerobaculia bacterium]|nr:hypothetical protein [Thermoanaerobaculia bacterium]